MAPSTLDTQDHTGHGTAAARGGGGRVFRHLQPSAAKLAWPTRDTASTSTSTNESLVVFHQAGSPNETSVYALYSCAFNASWCGTRAQALRQQGGTQPGKPGKSMWVRGQTAAQPATSCQLQLAASAA